MHMRYFTPQLHHDDCGLASLKMLLAIINKEQSFLDLSPPKINGMYSFLEMRNIALRYGVKLEGRSFSNNDDLMKEPVPFILQIQADMGKHFVLIRKIMRKKVVIYDPSFGKQIASKEEVRAKSLNNGLFFIGFTEESINKIPIKTIPISGKWPIILCNVLLVTSLLLGFYLLEYKKGLLSYILFFLTLLSSILHQILVRRSLQAFDEVIYETMPDVRKNVQEKMEKMLAYKKNLFERFVNMTTIVMYIIATIILLIINSFYSLIIVILILVVNLLKYTVFFPQILSKERLLADEEKKIITRIEKGHNVKDELRKIFASAYKIGLSYSFFEWGVRALIAAAVIGQAMLSQTLYLNYLLFYYAYYFFLLMNLNRLGQYILRRHEDTKLRQEVLNIINK